ncbi:AraC family transcriptional regulator [Leptospira kanakyensis]|uniref:AraC family transcriptional regulator n=1 Tax=Leptospira kanakyensis TaxID=2484968 RepID=A0A6N4Q9A5_9LEPT|nr:AraC family transcriptional regulator [Leptospira kanakyensis]MCW7468497.1 AraC family transcriptional regulator [Leptospira kanakyensis]TGK55566.1 AraC family transcriptional regulator [Leptospira kanakyensis]TGK61102.1 AraC family transcriptional regulator [Leptospira kanakyensis]TGK76426.1 AraC family transcriptional regulator [Leptospira kanakyensis]
MKQFLIWDDFATYRGDGFSSHRHSHFYIQISLPDSGYVELRTKDGEWKKYNAVCIPSGVSHEMRAGEGDLTLIYLDPLTTGYQLFYDRSLRAKQSLFEVGDLFTETVKQKIKQILSLSNMEVRTKLLDIIHQDFVKPKKQVIDPRIGQSIKNIELEDFSLVRLAADAGLSVDRFRHLFSQEVGVPFSAYRLWLKTKKAVDYLANHPHLLDAAYQGGFADQSHFTRVFLRSFGVTPSSFTKKNEPFTAIFFSK